MNAKVLVAMSGGVDSSVSAALLRKAGYQVAGVFLRCYESESCGAQEDFFMAKLVAKVLKIPFYTFDFRKEYQKKVIDYFVKEYAEGRTPNPDTMCNKEVKFGLLFQKAKELGFDFLATGHYARTREGRLFKGKDKNKDQSYFLYSLKSDILRRVIFPVGDLTKPEVRAIARALELPNSEKKDSQGICFVGKVKLGNFLDNYLKRKPGKILLRLKEGVYQEVGWHQGVHYFTIGQRHGLGLPGGPYYVYEIDTQNNLIKITKDEKLLLKKEFLVEKVNWVSEKEPSLPLEVEVKIRYRHIGAKAIVTKEKEESYKVVFNEPQKALAVGQAAVFYLGEELIGGGIISKVL